MNGFAKWVWIILLMSLYFGVYTFLILGLSIIVFALLWWFKPEWLEKF